MYWLEINGPLTFKLPKSFPFHGISLFSSSVIFISTIYEALPCFSLISTLSSKLNSSMPYLNAPIVPRGDISVIPHACITETSKSLSNFSNITLGTADPPIATLSR